MLRALAAATAIAVPNMTQAALSGSIDLGASHIPPAVMIKHMRVIDGFVRII
jgi:hypothetical protein